MGNQRVVNVRFSKFSAKSDLAASGHSPPKFRFDERNASLMGGSIFVFGAILIIGAHFIDPVIDGLVESLPALAE